MDQWLVITLRVVHILTGAAWVGGAFLLTGFILPRAKKLGPEVGGTYLNRFLAHPWFSGYISSVEGLAVLTGLVLYWNASGGLQGFWMTSPMGLAFSVGGLAALVASGLSFPISKSLRRLYYLVDDVDAEWNGDRLDVAAFKSEHTRLARIGALYSTLLAIAVAGMASAQYLT